MSQACSTTEPHVTPLAEGVFKTADGRLMGKVGKAAMDDFLSQVPRTTPEKRAEVDAAIAKLEAGIAARAQQKAAAEAQEAERDREARKEAAAKRRADKIAEAEAQGIKLVTVYRDLGGVINERWIRQELTHLVPSINMRWALEQQCRIGAMTFAMDKLKRAREQGKPVDNEAGYLFAVAREYQARKPTMEVPDHVAEQRPELIRARGIVYEEGGPVGRGQKRSGIQGHPRPQEAKRWSR